MVETSRPWSGIVTGDAGPYSDDQWTDVWKTLLGPTVASQGVFREQLNELNLTSITPSPVSIDTGRALVNGIWYETDAAVSVAVPTPGANPRVDRIVLRADWTLQTVRVTRVAGAEAATPVAPALTQTDGVTWDLPLWQVHITTGGVITFFADERDFIGQYEPVGPSENVIYTGWDFFNKATIADGDLLGPFEANIVGGGTITTVVEAGFGGGAVDLRHDGVGTGDVTSLFSRGYKPDQVNGRMRVRTRSPNTHANLDRAIGFFTAFGIAPTNGCFFRSDGTANWEAVCRAASVETAVATGQALDDVWREFEVRYVSDDAVSFFIDGVFITTINTNVPSDLTQEWAIGIEDDGVGTPTANPYMAVDYANFKGVRNVP